MGKTTHAGGETAWFTANGRRHRGEVGEDADGLPFGAGEVACATCAGSGMSRHSRGRQCRACKGEKATYQQFRIFDAVGLAALRTAKALGAVPKPRRRARGGAGRGRRPDGAEAGPGATGKPPAARGRAGRGVRPAPRPPAGAAESYEEYRDAHAGLFARAEGVANAFVRELLDKAREWGGLTEGQRLKLDEVVTGVERGRALHAASDFVGSPKLRLDLRVTCTEHRSFVARKFKGRGVETRHVTGMVDGDGNVLVAVTSAFSMSPGDEATVTGTVGRHDEEAGYRVTYLSRVVARDLVPAPAGWQPPQAPAARPAAPAPAPACDDGYDADFEDFPAPGA